MSMEVKNNIPDSWVKACIGEFGKTITGKTPSKNNPDDWGEKIDFITPSDIPNNLKVISNCARKLSEKGENRFKKMIIPKRSVIVTCIGSDMGKVVMNENKSLTNQQINSIKINDDYSNEYVYYLLKKSYKVLRRAAEGSGSTMPLLNKTYFESLSFVVPPLPEQKAIAKVLTAFDDKIELLQAQNRTLETMAQTIFKEWFGKYQIGDELPEGWRFGKLGDISTHLKKNIKPFDNPEKRYFHYSLPAYDNGLKPITESGSEIKSNKYVVEKNTFLVSKLNPFTPRIWTIFDSDDSNICSTEFQVVKPNEAFFFSITHCLLNSKYFTDNLSQKVKGTSSSHQRVNPEDIFEVDLIIPNKHDLIRFEKIVLPLITKKDVNHNNIQSLTKTRDTLLPKLMSGQVRVKNLKQPADA